jgi:hypothetical protein
MSAGYIQKWLKLYVYARVNGEKTDTDKLIDPFDKKLVTALLRSTNPKAVKLCKKCTYYARQGYTPKSLATFDRVTHEVITELTVYCRKFVNKKFLFLTQSGQSGKDDIAQMLKEFGIYAIYKAYPVIKTTLHMTNIAKTAIHNRGINYIKEQTTTSRSRVTRGKDGTFVGMVMSLNQSLTGDRVPELDLAGSPLATALVTGLDGRSVNMERFSDVNRCRDLEQTVNLVLDKLPKQRDKRFVLLLMGTYDEAFSAWLGQPNDDLYFKGGRTVYCTKVKDYLNMGTDHARSLLNDLRTQLSDFRN